MPSKRLNTATVFCKSCFKPIENNSLYHAFFGAKSLCSNCFRSLKPRYFAWKENGVKCSCLYPYSSLFRSMLYLFKGCGDIELGSVFLDRYRHLFHWMFRRYVIVPAPSHASRILERGFDHLPVAFAVLKLPFLHAIEKTDDVKQSDLGRFGRMRIGEHLRYVGPKSLKGKSVLFVDDVFTTGSTVRACLALLRKRHPKRLRVLVLSRVSKT